MDGFQPHDWVEGGMLGPLGGKALFWSVGSAEATFRTQL